MVYVSPWSPKHLINTSSTEAFLTEMVTGLAFDTTLLVYKKWYPLCSLICLKMLLTDALSSDKLIFWEYPSAFAYRQTVSIIKVVSFIIRKSLANPALYISAQALTPCKGLRVASRTLHLIDLICANRIKGEIIQMIENGSSFFI